MTMTSRSVLYAMVAEFDIDKGSVLRHQYPEPLGIKESHLAEEMLPEGAHLRETDWTVFFLEDKNGGVGPVRLEFFGSQRENNEVMDPPAKAEIQTRQTHYCCLNLVRTKKDPRVRRGAVVRSLAIVTPYRFYNHFKPVLELALDQYFDTPGVEVLEKLYTQMNKMDFSHTTSLSEQEKAVERALLLRASEKGQLVSDHSQAVVAKFEWDDKELEVNVPMLNDEDEVTEASLINLIKMFKENTMKIFNALICQKRIMFTGYQRPSGQLCTCVVSACLLVSPPFQGTLRRAFPYASLTNLDFLQVPGFVAGATNPIFESRSMWWDILCNITTGEVTVASSFQEELDQAAESVEKMKMLDNALFNEVLTGIRNGSGEEWVRCVIHDYAARIKLMSLQEEVFVNSKTESLYVQANHYRLAHYMQSEQFQQHQNARNRALAISRFGDKQPLIRRHLRTMQMKSSIPANELSAMLNDLAQHLKSAEDIQEFLSFLPESQAGVFPLSVCLFHSSPEIRMATVDIMKRLDRIPVNYRKATMSRLARSYSVLPTRHYRQIITRETKASTEQLRHLEIDAETRKTRGTLTLRLFDRMGRDS